MGESFWPTTLEGITTVIANLIAIGAVIPVARWGSRVRRELSEIRKRRAVEAGEGIAERERRQHISMLRPITDRADVWEIAWARLPGDTFDTLKTGQARITSPRLLRVVRTDPQRLLKARTETLVGSVRYTEHGGTRSAIEIYRLDYMTGDAPWWRVMHFARRAWAWLFTSE